MAVEKKGKKSPFIVVYHPKGRGHELLQIVTNKVKFGISTITVFERDPDEHPEGATIGTTSIRNGGTPLSG